MKRSILIGVVAIMAANVTKAQKPVAMKPLWEVKLGHDFDESGTDDNLLYGSNDKNYSVLKASDGSVLWSRKFKEIYPKINKIDLQFEVFDANALFMFEKKMGKDQLVVADMGTGKMLWSSEKYQNIEDVEQVFYVPEMEAFGLVTDKTLSMVRARTGEELWSTDRWNNPISTYLIDKGEGSITMLNMPRTFVGSLFKGFKNQIVKFDIRTGKIIWENTYAGLVQKKVVSRARMADLKVVGNKLFLQLNGLQVFDYQTGSPLWKAQFDVSFDNVVGHVKGGGRTLKKGVYGCVADPIIDGDFVYVIDMKSRGEQYLKKYQLSTGKLVWSSPEIKDAKVMPGMIKMGDVVVLQVGGAVEVQAKTEKRVGDYIVTKFLKYYQNVGPYNVQAFNAADGKQLWQSDKFKRGITNITSEGSNLLVCSGKALYSIDYRSGKENYEMQLAYDDIALAQKIINSSEIGKDIVASGNVLVLGEKGVSCHEAENGKKLWAIRIKDADFNGIYGKTAFFEKENGDVFAIDVNSGTATYCDARKDSKTAYSSDGAYLYLFEKKNIVKFSTN